MILRFNLKKALMVSFAALGPLGNLLTPHFFPDSFRAYYFLLPFFPLFFFMARERIVKIGIFFLPFLIYCYVSAFILEIKGTASESYTLFRFFLLFCQFFFVLGAASALRKKEEIFSLLKTYLTFYFISLGIGYLFFIGYYLKIVPIFIIARFSVLTQFGFGLLRFSPGSYPNEYGILSSFILSILVLIYLDKKQTEFEELSPLVGRDSPTAKERQVPCRNVTDSSANSALKGRDCAPASVHFSKKWFYFLFLATFLAFLLTTTRAAYLSFFVSMIYLSWKSGHFLKVFTYVSLSITAFFGFLLLFKLNMFRILTTGFSQRIDEGSLGERYFMWLEAVEKVQDCSFWGTGFASLTNIHNVYLQLLFELGVVGMILLLGSLLIVFLETFFKYKRPMIDEMSPFLVKIRTVGLINVLSFATSNHNLNHHLTWFVCFLCFATLRLPYLYPTRFKTSILARSKSKF